MAKLEAFIKAKEKLSKVLLETHLIYSPIFSKESGNKVFIKPENLQKTGSFKIRGAYNKISNLTDAERKRGVIASSAGNHAQGVAYAAKESGIKAVIVMPKSTPLIKVESTKQYGAEVILYGDVYDDAYKKAKELEEKEGYVFVHPFNDEDVLDGQGTIALEILEELPETDIILVPIGGGGLISGIACAAKILKPEIKIIGVEPEGAASAYEAIKENKVVELKEANTIADGTAVKKIGDLNFEYIKKYVDEIITVSDYELMEAFLFLTGVKVEGVTLFSMIAAAVAGALVGARIVNKLPEKKIQLVMGVCLIVTAFLMMSGQLGWLKALGDGNEAVGLTGVKLIIGVVGNFILGALMMAGVGLYAPCMAMVYMLGLSPLVAFPIMMGSCAGLMAIGSPEFIKAGNYTRIGSIAIAIGGIIGVTVAYLSLIHI